MHIFSPKKGALVITLAVLFSAGIFAIIAVISLPETAHTQEGSWQRVGSAGKSLSCKPPNHERERGGPPSGMIYDADGSSEKIRVIAEATASTESCDTAQNTPSGNADQPAGAALAAKEETDPPGDGDSTGGGGSGGSGGGSGSGSGGSGSGSGNSNECEGKKATAYVSYGIEAFGNSSSLYARATIGQGKTNSYGTDSYSQTFTGSPTGEVSFRQTDQSLYCHAYYDSDANANFSITVYEWVPDDNGGGGGGTDPTASDDGPVSLNLCKNDSVDIDVLSNDTDGDGDDLSIESPGDPSNGTTIGTDKIRYTPDFGPDDVTFNYTVSDGNDGTNTAKVKVNVSGSNEESDCGDDGDDPNAVCKTSPDNPKVGDEIEFDGSDSADPDDDIDTYDWDVTLPDGSEGERTGEKFSGTADQSGTYDADLTVTDKGGNTGETTCSITVDPGNKCPDGSGVQDDTYSVKSGETLEIDAPGVLANDSDPDGDTLEASVVSGPSNGSLTLNQDGSFTYAPADGFSDDDTFTYQAGDGECSAQAGVTITVTDTPPPNPACEITPSDPVTGDDITFDGSASSDPDGSISQYAWSIYAADGDTFSGGGESTTLNGADVDTEGDYSAELGIADDDGQVSTTTCSVTVGSGQAPNPVCEITSSDPSVGDSLTFDGSASNDPDGSIEQYAWSIYAADGDTFPRGNESTTLSGSNVDTDGDYSAELAIADDDGNVGTTTCSISVGQIDDPTASCTASPENGEASLDVSYDGTDSSAPEDASIESYSWNFGDGASGSGSQPSNTYNSPGEYTASVTVTDTNDNTDSTDCPQIDVSTSTGGGGGGGACSDENKCNDPGPQSPTGASDEPWVVVNPAKEHLDEGEETNVFVQSNKTKSCSSFTAKVGDDDFDTVGTSCEVADSEQSTSTPSSVSDSFQVCTYNVCPTAPNSSRV
jgi:chitodextrinase